MQGCCHDQHAESIVNLDLMLAFQTFDVDPVVGWVGVEVDGLKAILIHACAFEEGGQHDVVVDQDFLGVVGGAVAPFLEVEAVGGDGSNRSDGASLIGACTEDEAFAFVIIHGHGVGLDGVL